MVNNAHHVRCNGLPLCIIPGDTAGKICFHSCGANSNEEARLSVAKCKESLLRKGEDLSNFLFEIIEGSCPESSESRVLQNG